jgi:hypothetical protein
MTMGLLGGGFDAVGKDAQKAEHLPHHELEGEGIIHILGQV